MNELFLHSQKSSELSFGAELDPQQPPLLLWLEQGEADGVEHDPVLTSSKSGGR